MIFGFVKFLAFFFVTFLFIIHHTVMSFLIRNEERRMRYWLKSVSQTAKLGLWILNVKVSHKGSARVIKQRLIVSNHLSYVDVLVIASFYPSLFVTSVEIKETFLLGKITQLAGCFFVERRKEKRTEDTKVGELQDIKSRFNNSYNIFLFPEGTSSNGKEVLPFKATFFQLAVDTNTPVVPLCIKYPGTGLDFVPWYGEMGFPLHLLKLCFQKEILAELTEQEELWGKDRFEFSQKAHKYISEAYAQT